LTKTLTIREEVYDKLTAVKGKEESFSELFDRLVNGAGSLESLKKLRGSVEFVDKKKMLREIEASRAERRI
jgi:predicted CopG family antitoxin